MIIQSISLYKNEYKLSVGPIKFLLSFDDSNQNYYILIFYIRKSMNKSSKNLGFFLADF